MPTFSASQSDHDYNGPPEISSPTMNISIGGVPTTDMIEQS